jgi:hypothetical protein
VAPLINAILSRRFANVVNEGIHAIEKLRRFVGDETIKLLMRCLETGGSVAAAIGARAAIGPGAVCRA